MWIKVYFFQKYTFWRQKALKWKWKEKNEKDRIGEKQILFFSSYFIDQRLVARKDLVNIFFWNHVTLYAIAEFGKNAKFGKFCRNCCQQKNKNFNKEQCFGNFVQKSKF